MNGIRTSYSSLRLLKKAQTCRDLSSTAPPRWTGFLDVMKGSSAPILSVQAGLETTPITNASCSVFEKARHELHESAEHPGRLRAHSGRRSARSSLSGCSS